MRPSAKSIRQSCLDSLKQAPSLESIQQLATVDAAKCADELQLLPDQEIDDTLLALAEQVHWAVWGLAKDANDPDDEHAPAFDAEQEQQAVQVAWLGTRVATQLLPKLADDRTDALLEVAVKLHNRLLALASWRQLQDEIATLCLAWWQRGLPSREQLVTAAIPYMLMCAVGGGKAEVVRALWAMRGALALINFDHEDIGDMKCLLLHTVLCPAFLQRAEGTKFVAYAFTLHPALTRDLASIVRNQVPAVSRKVQQTYGAILFRAWRQATGECLQEIESSVQGLMLAAILARTDALAAGLRTVLDAFHAQKKLPEVDALLLRLYSPILFRHTAVANAAVRCNALRLLFDAFPLMDPAAPHEEVDALLKQQFVVVSDALADDAPVVRIVAVHGVCTLLNLFWELIPAATAAGYVSRVTNELVHDMSTPGVRAAALEGLSLLLSNGHAQPMLKKVLPNLVVRLGDPSPRVRQTMAHLLAMAAESTDLQGRELVPSEVLLDILVHDAPAVAQPVQQLLLATYYPSSEEGPARVGALLQRSPQAGQAFCAHLVAHYRFPGARGRLGLPARHLTTEQLRDLAKALAVHLEAFPPVAGAAAGPAGKRRKQTAKQAASRRKPAATGKRRGAKDAGEGSSAPSSPQAVAEPEESTPESWVSVLLGLEVLCSGLAAAVEQQQCDRELLHTLLEPPMLLNLLSLCPDAAARKSVLAIAAALPQTAAARRVRDHCFQQLVACPAVAGAGRDPAVEEQQRVALLECCFAANSGTKLLAAIQAALQPGTRPRVPAPTQGHNEAVFEDEACHVCTHSAPEDTLLLCDACDAAYHTACLTPRLQAVPTGAWHCPVCCHDIANAALSPAAALDCLALALSQEQCRTAMVESGALARMLPLLRGHAKAACDALCTHPDGAAASTSTSTPASGVAADAAGRGMEVYGRAALHAAAAVAMGVVDAAVEEGNSMPPSMQGVLVEVLGWCSRLVEAVQLQLPDPDALEGAQLEEAATAAAPAVRVLDSLLRLLADGLRIGLLAPANSLEAGGELPQLALLAAAAANLLLAAARAASAQDSATVVPPAWPQGLVATLMGLATELLPLSSSTEQPAADHAAQPGRASLAGSARLQLEPLLGSSPAASTLAGGLGGAAHDLASTLSILLCDPAATPLLPALRPRLPSFTAAGVRHSQAWLVPLLAAAGEAAVQHQQALGEGADPTATPGAHQPRATPLRGVRLTPAPSEQAGEAASEVGEEAEGGEPLLRLPPFPSAVVVAARQCRVAEALLEACTATAAAAAADAALPQEERLLAVLGAVTLIPVLSRADEGLSCGAGGSMVEHLRAAEAAVAGMEVAGDLQELGAMVAALLAQVLQGTSQQGVPEQVQGDD